MRVSARGQYLQTSILLAFLLIILQGLLTTCTKKDLITDPVIPVTPIPGDSLYKITDLTIANLNQCSISLAISPPANDSFRNGKLLWSTRVDFQTYDSLPLFQVKSYPYIQTVIVDQLSDSTPYYFRISLKYKNTTLQSETRNVTTSKLRITSFPAVLSKGVYFSIVTNYTDCGTDTSAKVFLNNTACELVASHCGIISVIAPPAIETGNYKLSISLRGMRSEAPDSVEILPGKWTLIEPPFIPVGLYNGAANGIGGYTVCTAPTKSYLLGGRTLYPVNNFGYPIYPDYNYQRPKFILEFNSLNKQWLKRMVNNPRQFADIAAQYYNNAIYVMGGVEESENNSYVGHLDKMLKLDLNTMGWSVMDTLPFGKLTYPVSTQLNNEFYAGLGEKYISILSMPDPFGQLWKYNPQLNSWTRMADFPGRFQRYPTMLTLNDKVLVYSGAIPVGALQPHTTFEKELWEYSPASNQWRQISLPADSILPQGEKCSIAAVNGKLCFFIAQKNTLYSYYYSMALKQIFVEFNPSTNTWKRFSLPTSGGDLMKVIFQNNNTVFLHSDQFGYTNSNMNQTYQFDRE